MIHSLENKVVSTSIYWIIGLFILLRLFGILSADPLVEEAYYWNYAQHLDLGYIDHPPMVAVLIYIANSLFGSTEFALRFPSLLCWVIAAFFSYKLTNLMEKGAGIYAVLLLSILPFFFIQSLVITPDQPLIACWSASLYYLYRLLNLEQSKYWYKAGFALGLGLLSKYSIVLLGPSVLLYMLFVPKTRTWLYRKEFYLTIALMLLLFSPVIYWNMTHDWASFIFQSSRRFQSGFDFTLHKFIGLLFVFLTPLGFYSFLHLFQKKNKFSENELENKRFTQIFVLVPILFFGVFSLMHSIKFNWIGPALLAFIPWLSIEIQETLSNKKRKLNWLITSGLLFLSYLLMIVTIAFGIPESLNKALFKKFIDWKSLSQDFYEQALIIENQTTIAPIFIPLDPYNLGSELAYYQHKFLTEGKIKKIYPIAGRHYFGYKSLMYRYWSPEKLSVGEILILISTDLQQLKNAVILFSLRPKTEISEMWSHGQKNQTKMKPYYYQVVEVNNILQPLIN